jgi:hypothetical protein
MQNSLVKITGFIIIITIYKTSFLVSYYTEYFQKEQ